MSKVNRKHGRTKSIGIAVILYMIPLVLVAVLTTAFTSLEKGALEEKKALTDSLQSRIDTLTTHKVIAMKEDILQVRLLRDIDSLFNDWQIKAEKELQEGRRFLPDGHNYQLEIKIDSLGEDLLETQIKRRLEDHRGLLDARYNVHILGDSTSNYGGALQQIRELEDEIYQLRRELLQPPTCPPCPDCESAVNGVKKEQLTTFISMLKDWENQRKKDLKTLIPKKIKELERQVDMLRLFNR